MRGLSAANVVNKEQLEVVRYKTERVVNSQFRQTKALCGKVALPSLAQGMIDAMSAQFVAEYGEQLAYEIFATAADRIIENRAHSDLYLAAVASQIVDAAKRAKS